MGILWDEIEDNLVFQLDDVFKNATNVNPTRRNILSVISTVCDPVGYLQSLTIPLKILFQKVCKLDTDWDDSISKLVVEWKKISKNLKRCEEIVIKRSYFISLGSMHLFTISNTSRKYYS